MANGSDNEVARKKGWLFESFLRKDGEEEEGSGICLNRFFFDIETFTCWFSNNKKTCQ